MFRHLSFLLRTVCYALPLASRTLRPYRDLTSHMSGVLGEQARASIKEKTFHCQGASVYALYPPLVKEGQASQVRYVRFAVALQTISDYLDNLCDRAKVYDEKSFRTLHGAFCDALSPHCPRSDYYAHYPYRDDNGYLARLVTDSRRALTEGCAPDAILPYLHSLARHYSDLQTYKHIAPSCREERMRAWTSRYQADHPDLSGWEFAAACGSTLGIFALVCAKEHLRESEAERIYRAYFPYINGLHILLDYLIDREEDRTAGDLNFTFYYPSAEMTADRIVYFTEQALRAARTAPESDFHTHIIYALLALYLTDDKCAHPAICPIVQTITARLTQAQKQYFPLCRLLRRLGRINR